MDLIFGYLCSISVCLVPIVIFMSLLAFIVWIIVRSEKGKVVSKDSGYYRRVLKDLDQVQSRSTLDNGTFKTIYNFFKLKLDDIQGIKVEKKGKKERPIPYKTKPKVEEEAKLKIEKKKERREGVVEYIRRFLITEFSANLLLYLGSLLVISAALILIAFNWEQFGNLVKALILPTFIFVFLLFGFIFYNTKRVRSAGITFLIISNILIPLAFVSLWRFILQESDILSFWSYWLIASFISFLLSVVYNLFLKKVVTKVLVIFNLNSLLISLGLAFQMGVLSTAFTLLSLNLIVLIASQSIKDKFLKISAIVVSFIFNFVLSVYSILYLFTVRIIGSNVYDMEVLSDTLFSRVMTLCVLLVPVLFILTCYLQSKKWRWLYYFILLPLTLYNVVYYYLVWGIQVEHIILILIIFIYCFFFLEEVWKKLKRKIERIYSFICSIALPFIILSWIFSLDITNGISDCWIYTFLLFIIAYFLIRYFWNKSFIYLGIVSWIVIYPIFKFVSSIDPVVEYFFSLAVFCTSVVYLLVSMIIMQLKAKRSSLSLLPAFYFLNLIGTFGLIIQNAETMLVGLFFLANLVLYLLTSLFLYKGKFTQMCALWGIGAILFIFGKYLSTEQLAGMYLLFGTLIYFVSEAIRYFESRWETLPEVGLVNCIRDLKVTCKIFAIFAFAISILVAIFSTSLWGFSIAAYLLVASIFLAYRFGNKQWFVLVFIFQYFLLVKCLGYFEIQKEFYSLSILILGGVNYACGLIHEQVKNKLQGFKDVYFSFGLFGVLLVYVLALLNVWGLENGAIYIQTILMMSSIIIILFHGLKEKNLSLNIIPAYLFVFLLSRIGIEYEIENSLYYLVPLGLAFHSTNLILKLKKKAFASNNVFDVLGIVTILGVSLLKSVNNGFYLLILIFEGGAYVLLWPYFKRKSLAVLSLIFIGLGVLIQLFNLILSFPQWLVLGITGVLILAVAVVFLVVRGEKK